MKVFLAGLETEVTVVSIVCLFFLFLMVVAGIRQIYKKED